MKLTIAEVMGGLGNQMFIYAFARALQLERGGRCVLVDRRDGPVAHCVCGLGELSLSPDVELVAEADYMKKTAPFQNALRALALRRESRGGMMNADWRGFEARIRPAMNLLGCHLATEGYLPCTPGPGNILLAWGYFQSERYFAPHRKTILAELQPAVVPTGPFAEALAQAGKSGRTICVHVRRGDYLRPENAALQVCGTAYYRAAMDAAEQARPGAVMVFFSDDPDWVKEHLRPRTASALYAPAGGSAAGDLALMSRCSDFILSNSTYSWWAQELGTDAEKRVWAPAKWYANGKETALYQDFWELVETD